MIGKTETFLRKIRRLFSKSEWTVRLLKMEKAYEGNFVSRGLIMIQVDGLSYNQLKTALDHKKMPFLKALLSKEQYQLEQLYSGLPSNTPGFQAELFYGVKTAIPAFSFMDRKKNKILRMFAPNAASETEKKLASSSFPLLKGGSVYADIFSGGAKEAHFCFSEFRLKNFLRSKKIIRYILLLILNLTSFIRVVLILILEGILSLIDFMKGLVQGQNFIKELKFIPTRVGICILLRELITIMVKLDTARGLPVIHLNLSGYDEQAHRRGPSSRFAHWTLKGIDDAIRKIWNSAHLSNLKDYDVWIYSDHGQETCLSYQKENGKNIIQTVSKIFHAHFSEKHPPLKNKPNSKSLRENSSKIPSFIRPRWFSGTPIKTLPLTVTGMGPLGMIYYNAPLTLDEKRTLAQKMVTLGKIPLVSFLDDTKNIVTITEQGEFQIPNDKKQIFGDNHPFLNEITKDFIRLCQLPDCGDFVISGWKTKGFSISFPIENGSHGGIGTEETMGFALLPNDFFLNQEKPQLLRPLILREKALEILGTPQPNSCLKTVFLKTNKHLRIMTYNTHGCAGMDGKISPERIARVIAQQQPDIVTLQELDAGRSRSNFIHQAQEIAKYLNMEFHFHPVFTIEQEEYGNAILSHYPMKLIKTGELPVNKIKPFYEPRGVIWVRIDITGEPFHIFNTHFGLRNKERLNQVETLMNDQWLKNPDIKGHIALCGDFNATPASQVWKNLNRILKDAQTVLKNHCPQNTFCGRFPSFRIDHIFVDPKTIVKKIEIPNTRLSRLASDHLPLIAEIEI